MSSDETTTHDNYGQYGDYDGEQCPSDDEGQQYGYEGTMAPSDDEEEQSQEEDSQVCEEEGTPETA